MVAPLAGVPLAGVIWYQGESNAGTGGSVPHPVSDDDRRLAGAAWGTPALPFLLDTAPQLRRVPGGGGGRGRASPARVALAWLLAQKPWIVPIPGTRRLERLDENIGAADIRLSADDLGRIEAAAAAMTVLGARYPEHLERLTGL